MRRIVYDMQSRVVTLNDMSKSTVNEFGQCGRPAITVFQRIIVLMFNIDDACEVSKQTDL